MQPPEPTRQGNRPKIAGPNDKIFSPSQIETFMSCQRKWAWRYIAHVKTEPHKSAALGTHTHTELERYLAGGEIDYSHGDGRGYIAAAGLEWLPKPNAPGLVLEGDFAFRSPVTGFIYRGFKDFAAPDSAIMPGLPGGVPLVGDHKTTSDLKWAKSAGDLEWDVQAVTYAFETLLKTGAPAVDLTWIYYQTRGTRRSKRVHLRMTAEHAQKVFSEIEWVTKEMSSILDSGYQPKDLPANTGACGSYGGCPYQHLCDLSPGEKVRAMIHGQDKQGSLLDRLKARNATPDTTQPTTDGITFNDSWKAAEETTSLDAPAVVKPGQINPPEFQPAPTAEERDAKPTEAPKKGPGRPKGSKNKTEETAKAADTIPAPPIVPSIEQPALVPVEGIGIGTLYVNCLPVGAGARAYRLAEDLIAKARATVNEAANVADYRFCEYGQGAGAISVAINALADNLAGADVVIDTRTPEGAIALPGLVVRAGYVVRGML